MGQAVGEKTEDALRGVGLVVGLMVTGLLCNQAQANPDPYLVSTLDLSVGLESMEGDLTSSIGGAITHADGQAESTYFPISELEWPLDILLARFDGSLTMHPMWRINGTLKTAVDGPGDDMIDRDWFSGGGGPDIYSQSSISAFEALILDVDFEWTYLRQGPWSLYTGVGYLHQDFEYEGDLIVQFSPTGITGYNYLGNGSTGITYDTSFSMMYFLLGADIQITHHFDITGKFSMSPLASSEDELRHLYYNKVSTGDLEGTAYMFELSSNLQLTPWWFVKAGLQYSNIAVDGDQYQVLGGAPIGQIDQEVESVQSSGYISTGYSF